MDLPIKPPSSTPPTVAHNDPLADRRAPSPTTVQSRRYRTAPSSTRASSQQNLSPEVARFFTHLRTPIRAQNTLSDSSSNYFTAAWGSPADSSPGPSQSAHTAVSAPSPTDERSSSPPEHLFSLDHLIPTRLPELSFPRASPHRESAIEQAVAEPPEAQEDNELTPRSRTRRWIQLPQRQDSTDKRHWWSDGSASSVSRQDEADDEDLDRVREGSPSRPMRTAGLKSHRTRDDNRTLNQRDFWETLREQRVESNMDGLSASKWAATQPLREEEGSNQREHERLRSSSGVYASKWAAASAPHVADATQLDSDSRSVGGSANPISAEILRTQSLEGSERNIAPKSQSSMQEPGNVPDGESPVRDSGTPIVVSAQSDDAAETDQAPPRVDEFLKDDAAKLLAPNTIDVFTNSEKSTSPLSQITDAVSKATPANARLEPRRSKKKISYRGKNLVISIPAVDYEALGITPLSPEEVQLRLLHWEQEGFDIQGFDVSIPDNDPNQPTHEPVHRPIYPDENDMWFEAMEGRTKVILPDLKKWQSYMDALTEAKLAALGVTLGPSEPEREPQPSQIMSRQSSNQYPPLPFSPPIQTTSAGSMGPPGRPGLIRGHSHTMSVAAPMAPMPGPFGHMHRHSTFHGPGSFFPQPPLASSPLGLPGMQGFPQNQQYGLHEMQRGESPARMAAFRPDFAGIGGSGSPLGQHVLPQSPQGFPAMPVYQRQRTPSLSHSIASPQLPILQPAMNTFITPPLQPPSLRPTPALPEVQEDDEPEDEVDEKEDRLYHADAYVPPHKRAHLNVDIAIPSPKGHSHNISETLERDVLEKDWQQKPYSDRLSGSEGDPVEDKQQNGHVQTVSKPEPGPEVKSDPSPAEPDPLGGDSMVKQGVHAHKRTTSRSLNAAAASFTFNPGATFKPQSQESSFNDAPIPQQVRKVSLGHRRGMSSGSFNPAASVFKPSNPPSATSSTFTFGSPKPLQHAPLSLDNQPLSPQGPQPFTFAAEVPTRQSLQSNERPIPFAFGAEKSMHSPLEQQAGFSFTAQRPAAQSEGAESEKAESGNWKTESIFGKVEIPDIVKPSRKSKAIAIVKPQELPVSAPATDEEDSDGRIMQNPDRMKRSRFTADDGDEVPQFAEPTPEPDLPSVLPEQVVGSDVDDAGAATIEDEQIRGAASESVNGFLEDASKMRHTDFEKVSELVPETEPLESEPESVPQSDPEVSITVEEDAPEPFPAVRHSPQSDQETGVHSTLAAPFQIPGSISPVSQSPDATSGASMPPGHRDEVSDLEEGEIREDSVSPVSPQHPHVQATHAPHLEHNVYLGRIDDVPQADPSFDEIDAVMRQLNEVEEPPSSPARVLPNLPSPDFFPAFGRQSFHWSVARSERGPSDPNAQWVKQSPGKAELQASLRKQEQAPLDNVDEEPREEPREDQWAPVNRLNNPQDVPMSDWSGMLSTPGEEKLQARSSFFDSHIDRVIGNAIADRLKPIEETLRSLHDTTSRRTTSRSSPFKYLAPSTADSDADDEDDSDNDRSHPPPSRGRDRRVDQMKSIVAEALREQGGRPLQSQYDIADLHSALADMKISFARVASENLVLDDIRQVIEEAVGRQSSALVSFNRHSPWEQHRRELSEIEGRLNETLAGALEEANTRHAAEARDAESRRQLTLAEEELALLRDTYRDNDSRLLALEDERTELIERVERAEDARQNMEDEREDLIECARRAQKDARRFEDERDGLSNRLNESEDQCQRLEGKIASLEAENVAVQATLDEYRLSSDKWRSDIDADRLERTELLGTIAELESRLKDSQDASTTMRRRLEKLHSDMATAAGQLASEKAALKSREEEYRVRCEVLENERGCHFQDRQVLEDELRSLRSTALDAAELKATLEHTRNSNVSLQGMIQNLQSGLVEQQALAAKWERDFHDAREAGRAEVQRTKMALEIDVESANHQVNIVRAALETELSKVSNELDNVRIEMDTAKARHDMLLEESEATRRDALRKVNHDSSVALDEARQKHDAALKELTAQHSRNLQVAKEDKKRSESHLHERLGLSDEKVRHYQERVQHLEERLEVTKSAAQAAAMNAKSSKPQMAADTARNALPEKISPQALRESILVLQEQLQEREATIEQLKSDGATDAEAKVKERDTEIAWLRELLEVRHDDLSELVNSLTKPNFNREAVRNTAIRISANLQMEQQEKARSGSAVDQSLSGQALASLSSLASPGAARLTSAFNSWRASMESANLKKSHSAPRGPATRTRTNTPSRGFSAGPSAYFNGLMTPPTSNLRRTPTPQQPVSIPGPKLHSRQESLTSNKSRPGTERRPSSQLLPERERSATPTLFRDQNYDQDADAGSAHLHNFEEDEDLDVEDSEPPAFRSLDAELEDRRLTEEEAEEEEEEEEQGADASPADEERY